MCHMLVLLTATVYNQAGYDNRDANGQAKDEKRRNDALTQPAADTATRH